MSKKTYTRAGISSTRGVARFRFTNDLNRELVLSRAGDTDIQFFELGEPMTKQQATEFLLAQGLVESTPSQTQHTAPTVQTQKSRTVTPKNTAPALYDQHSAPFRQLVAEKRQMFPSHTEEQLMELVHFQARANAKAFGTIEVPF